MSERFTLLDNRETIIDNESVADDGGKQIYWTVEYVQVVKLVKLMNELDKKDKEGEECYRRLLEKYDDLNQRLKIANDNVYILQCEKERLKRIRKDLINELNIVENELNIAIDNGFAPTQAYIDYMASKKSEYEKFWERKLKTYTQSMGLDDND